MSSPRRPTPGRDVAGAGFLLLAVNLVCAGIGAGLGALVGALVRLSFVLVRPLLLVLGAVKLCEELQKRNSR